MTEEKPQRKTIASVTKAMNVINHLAYSDKGLGVTEISEDLGMGVSATYHLLNTLRECNIIDQNEKTKKFKLSLRLWQLGMRAFGQNDLSICLKPYIKDLKEVTGETANLTVLDDDHIVYIAQEESDKPIKMFTKVGASAPLHATGSGKIFLAYQSKEKRDSIIDRLELTKYTEHTLIEKDSLLKELDEIKEKGYGFDKEERNIDVFCIAAPIFSIDGEVLACISISGPKSRFTDEHIEIWSKKVLEIADNATSFIQGE